MNDISQLPITSTHWGTYRVETRNGKVSALHGFELDPDVSPIGNGIVDVLDGPSRIQKPAVRKRWLESGPGTDNNRRGADPFIEVSWDEAESLVATELQRVASQYGNQAIYAGSYGWASAGRFHHAQSQIHRFLKCAGGYTASRHTYSYAAAEVIVPHVLGQFHPYLAYATSWSSIIDNTTLLVAFGGIPLKNGQINSGGVGRHIQREYFQAATAAGVKMVNVSPIRSDIEDAANAEWIAARPGTDTALMLGIASTLHRENLLDRAFLDRYTVGYEKFQHYLEGKKDGVVKDAPWAAAICGIPEESIVSLARQMAANRTMISISWSLTRQDHGEQPYWAAITLACMLGQIGLPGGGIGFGYSATNGIGDDNTKIPGASLPQGDNPVDAVIPVARISDCLLHPGESFEFDGITLQYPDIHTVYWAGGNPFHHHQDLNRMLKAWQKPDSIIVHDWCWNSLAKHADIVLPCTTTLERNDISFSPRDPYAVAMPKIVEPPGEARNDYDILSGISRKMGIEAQFTEGRDESAWLDWIYQATRDRCVGLPDYDSFKQKGWYIAPPPDKKPVLLETFRNDPEGKPLLTPSQKIEIYSETIASFNYDDCPPHASWMEPLEWLGGDTSQHPLHLISNQPVTKLHSQLDHGQHSRAAKIHGREPVSICRAEAEKRGLQARDVVRVFNDRGACLGGLVIDDDIMPGVAQMSTGAWYDPLEPGVPGSLCKHGNPNVLTPDKGTSQLAQGPIAHTCLVQIEKFTGDVPPITAFDPPPFVTRN